MKLLQILLSQSEAGAETYFEKVAAAFEERSDVEQRLIIEAQVSREQRLSRVGCDFDTLPMGKLGKALFYNSKLKASAKQFDPEVTFTWVNRASRKAPPTRGITVGRLGGYYDVSNYTRCNHLVVNAPDLVRHVMEGGWPEDAVSLISNFGDTPSGLNVDAAIPEIPSGVPVLFLPGRLHWKKAQDVLIRALPKIREGHLLIAGDGPTEQELKELAQAEGVASRVHFLGLRKDIVNLFKRADVCVFPSRFEPLGNVVLESWSQGVPIVAAASSGPAWLIDEDTNGLLFPVDDVDACAQRVNAILADPSLGVRLAQAGKVKLD